MKPTSLQARIQTTIASSIVYGSALLLSLFAYGYKFPSKNNLAELPPIYALLDPSLYTQDFYVQSQLGLGVRFFFNYAMAAAAQLVGDVPAAYFLCYTVAFCSFWLGIYKLGERVGGSKLTAGLAVLLCLQAESVTVSTVDIFRTEPIPAVFAMGVAVWGLYFTIGRSWRWGYFCFGVAALIQFLVGFIPGLLVLPSLISETLQKSTLEQKIACFVPPFSLWSGFLALVYLPLAWNNLQSDVSLLTSEFIRLYAEIRHPHHIFPSTWQIGDFLVFCVGGGLCFCNTVQLKSEHKCFLSTIVCVSLFSLVVTYLFTDIYPVELIVKLQLGRTSPFLAIALLLAISSFVTQLVQERRYAFALLVLTAPCLPLGYTCWLGVSIVIFLQSRKAISERALQFTVWLLLSLVFAVQVNLARTEPIYELDELSANGIIILAVLLPWIWEKMQVNYFVRLERFYQRLGLLLGLIASIVVLYLGLNYGLSARSNPLAIDDRMRFNKSYTKDVELLSMRLPDRLPNDSLILIPPSLDNFRMLSRQSVVFDFKGFPYQDWAIQEWGKRLDALMGDTDRPPRNDVLADRYCSASAAELIAIATQFEATHILSNEHCQPPLALPTVEREGGWRLFELHR